MIRPSGLVFPYPCEPVWIAGKLTKRVDQTPGIPVSASCELKADNCAGAIPTAHYANVVIWSDTTSDHRFRASRCRAIFEYPRARIRPTVARSA
jgi:hypothetical protein